MTKRYFPAVALFLLLPAACAAWRKPDGTIAYECFKDDAIADAFAHFAMRRLIEFSRATGVGADKSGITIWTMGPNPCDTGSIARLADDADVYTPEEEVLFGDAFRDAAEHFTAVQQR